MARRIGIVIHWLGWLAMFYLAYLFATNKFMRWAITLDSLFSTTPNNWVIWWAAWIAITHYPIKWVLTGNKSFWPWKGG